jgi:hypothetical protein
MDSIGVARHLRHLAAAASSPHSDGFTQCSCKHDLFLLKCLIDDLYRDLPVFPQQEKEWEQKRLLELLQK